MWRAYEKLARERRRDLWTTQWQSTEETCSPRRRRSRDSVEGARRERQCHQSFVHHELHIPFLALIQLQYLSIISSRVAFVFAACPLRSLVAHVGNAIVAVITTFTFICGYV